MGDKEITAHGQARKSEYFCPKLTRAIAVAFRFQMLGEHGLILTIPVRKPFYGAR